MATASFSSILWMLVFFFVSALHCSHGLFDTLQACNTPSARLGGTIDLGNLGLNPASSIAFDPSSGNLFLALDGSGFAEITTTGMIVSTFNPVMPEVDDSGLSIDPTTGHLIFVNGLGSTNPEPIFEMTTDGVIVNQFNSPVVEGVGLAIDPSNQHLFVVDVGTRPPGLDLVRELELQGSTYVQVNSFTLPSVLDFADAGMEFYPPTDTLVVGGTFGDNPGVIYRVNRDGSLREPFFDTGISNGVAGIDFDSVYSKMFVLDVVDNIVYIFELRDRNRIYLPFIAE